MRRGRDVVSLRAESMSCEAKRIPTARRRERASMKAQKKGEEVRQTPLGERQRGGGGERAEQRGRQEATNSRVSNGRGRWRGASPTRQRTREMLARTLLGGRKGRGNSNSNNNGRGKKLYPNKKETQNKNAGLLSTPVGQVASAAEVRKKGLSH